MTNAQQWPLAFDSLTKGQVLSTAELETATLQKPADGDKWSLALLKLRTQIMQRRPDLVARVDHDTIRILSDAEVDVYSAQRAAAGVKTILVAEQMRDRIDVAALTDDELRRKESADRAVGALAEGVRQQISKHSRTFAAINKKADEA